MDRSQLRHTRAALVLEPDDPVFSFVADNQAKGISPVPAVTFHTAHALSAELWDLSDDEVMARLTEPARAYLGGAEVTSLQLKRWRYTGPVTPWPDPYLTLAERPGPLVLAGDLNVAPADADIYDPVRWRRLTHASPPERAAVAALGDLGLADVTRLHQPGPGVYTWWSYRPGQLERNRGLRIDLALCSGPVADRVAGVWIDTAERAGPGASDHAPLVLDLTPSL